MENEGRQVGDYRLLGEIGRGGMGIVFHAEQLSLRRRVALKLLPMARALDDHARDRFEREKRVLAKLHHPHIVRLLDAGEIEGQSFFAMEYVPSVDLGIAVERLADRDPARLEAVHLQEALEIRTGDGATTPVDATRASHVAAVVSMFAKLCDALAYAHEQGVIHRDIKPSNILVDRNGEPKLLDFGLSEMVDASPISSVGELMGTPQFMSPEQLLAGRVPIDSRTDIYSLAASMYQTLTLRPPFFGRGMSDLFRKIQWDEAAPIRRFNRAVPKDLELVIATAMAKNPDHRYCTAGDFAADLQRILTYDPVTARGTGALTKVSRRLRKHWIGVTLGGALAVVLGATGLHALHSWREHGRVITAERQQARTTYLELVGRVEAALQQGDLVAANASLGLLASVPVQPESSVSLQEQLTDQLSAAAEATLAKARHTLAGGDSEAVTSLLASLPPGTWSEQAAELANEAEHAASDRASLRLLGSSSEVDRRLGIRNWLAGRKARQPPSGVRDEAMLALLATATEAALREACDAVFATDFADGEQRLRELFAEAAPERAVEIAAAAVRAGRGDWRDCYAKRFSELCRNGDQGRLSLHDVFDSRDFTNELCSFAWQTDYRDDYSSGGSGIQSLAGGALVVGFVLHCDGVVPLCIELLAKANDDRVVALKVLGEIDDPSLASALDATIADSWDVWELSRAARMLARWQHPSALRTLSRAVGTRRGLSMHADGLPHTITSVLSSIGDREAAVAWTRDLFQQTSIAHELKVAAAKGVLPLPDPVFFPQHGEFPRGPGSAGRRRSRGLAEVVAGFGWGTMLEEVVPALSPQHAAAAGAKALRSAIDRDPEWLRAFEEKYVWSPRDVERDDSAEPPLLPRARVEWIERQLKNRPSDLVARLVPLLGDVCLPVRWAAASALLDAGAPEAAGSVIEAGFRAYPASPTAALAVCRLDLARGRKQSAVARLRTVLRDWEIPDTVLSSPVFEPIRDEIAALRQEMNR